MLRITSGEFRGRMIHAPASHKTRPTQARLRQALFNSIQTHISDAKVLDLYAGSGALGIEALSWGAREVVFIESNLNAAQLIEKNCSLLKVTDRSEVIIGMVEKKLEKIISKSPFDIVLADPPYEIGAERWLLEGVPWLEVLSVQGIFCLEWGKLKTKGFQTNSSLTYGLELIREKEYGDSVLTTFRRRSEVA